MLKDAFEKVAKETILNAVKEALALMREACSKTDDDDGSIPDPFDLFDNDTLDKLNELAREFGLLGDNNGSTDKEAFDFIEFLKTVTAGLSPSQKCSILVGELYRKDVITYIQKRIKRFYPTYSSFFSKSENLTMLLDRMGEFLDPEICGDNTFKSDSSNIPNRMDIFYGGCPEDMIKRERIDKLVNAGLTEDQARKQLSEEIGNKFKLLNQLQKLQDDTENAVDQKSCEKLNEAMKNNKSIEMLLSKTLSTTFDPIDISFNTEVRQFIPSLIDPTFGEALLSESDLPSIESISPDGKVDATTALAAAASGNKAASENSEHTSKSNAWGSALKTKTVYKIKVDEDKFGNPIFLQAAGPKPTKDLVFDPGNLKGLSQDDVGDAFEDAKSKAEDAVPTFSGYEVISQQIPATDPLLVNSEFSLTAAKPLKESFFADETIEVIPNGFNMVIPVIADSFVRYETTKSRANSDSYVLTIKSFSKNLFGNLEPSPLTSFRINSRIAHPAKKYMERIDYLPSLDSIQSNSLGPQSKFFSHYMVNKFKAAFGSSLAATDAQNLSGLTSKMDFASQGMYKIISEKIMRKMFGIIGESKYFDLSALRKVNFTPTTSEAAKNCDLANDPLSSDASLLSLSDIKKKAMDDFYDSNDVCDISKNPGELGPAQSASCDALLFMFIRTSVVETILNGFFAFTQYDLDSLLNEKMMKSFLFKRLKDDLLALRLYSKFKGRAKDIVQKRRETGQFIGAESGAECLKYLFDEQLPPINRKFKTLLKEDVRPTELVFLNSLKTIDSVRRLNAPPGTKGSNNFPRDYSPSSRFYGEALPASGGKFEYNLSKDGDLFIEHYIKVVDHYDENGKALLDNFITQNNLLYLFEGEEVPTSGYYNDDGTRKDFLRGFVSFEEWNNFINYIKTLAVPIPELANLMDSNIYEFFSELTVGIRLNYVISKNADNPFEAAYKEIIDETLDVLASETTSLSIGGQVSFRNREFSTTLGELSSIHIVPLLATEKAIQDITPQKNAVTMNDIIGTADQSSLEYGNLTNIYNSIKQDLKSQMTKSDEFSALMKYVFPVKRYTAISTLYTMLSTKAQLPSKDTFITTKFLIKRAFELHSAGNDKEYEDAWLKLVNGSAGDYNDSSAAGGDFDPFRDMMLKIILETPKLILKGMTEITDPNIGITKKIYDGINLVSKLAKQSTLKGIEDDYTEYAASEAAKAGKTPAEFTMEFSFGDFIKENGIELPDIDTDVSPSIAPLISLLMLPSALPYGVGFPPPPLGPGFGPPMTPLAIPYHIFGLISDGSLKTPGNFDLGAFKKPGCAPSLQGIESLLPPPEEDSDDETDVVEINEE